MKIRMHILDDLADLSPRARDLLGRTGRRTPQQSRTVPDPAGQAAPIPDALAIRRDEFDQRFGGLGYQVRRSFSAAGQRFEASTGWEYILGTEVWPDPTGGYFDWTGEHRATPVRYLLHSNGTVGVDDGSGIFLPIAPSIPHLIESHALEDSVSPWNPWPVSSHAIAVAQHLDGLAEVSEASGHMLRWRISDTVAVVDFDNWNSGDRVRRAFIWSYGEDGYRQVADATTRVAP
ncbi:MAG: hypothetical protein ABW215_19525 [Kibdelosporangium sp.]